MPTKDTPQKKLFANNSLLVLRKKWFSIHKVLADVLISNNKYKYLKSKHKNSFYTLNNQIVYSLIDYFVESEITNGNVNKF